MVPEPTHQIALTPIGLDSTWAEDRDGKENRGGFQSVGLSNWVNDGAVYRWAEVEEKTGCGRQGMGGWDGRISGFKSSVLDMLRSSHLCLLLTPFLSPAKWKREMCGWGWLGKGNQNNFNLSTQLSFNINQCEPPNVLL